jgi:hypothetical protein
VVNGPFQCGDYVALPSVNGSLPLKRLSSLSFTLPDIPRVTVEFRCMFLPVSATPPSQGDHLLAEASNNIPENLQIYFNTNIAEQVTPGNYIIAKFEPDDKGNAVYTVTIDGETTDNFGNEIVNGLGYIPVILTVYAGGAQNQDRYINALSSLQAAPIVLIQQG